MTALSTNGSGSTRHHHTASSTPTTNPHAVTEAAPAQVRAWLASGEATLVDVREPDEFARERIDGAFSLPLSGLDLTRLSAHARKGRTLVLHCRSGRRSADACRLAAPLAAAGYHVCTLTGGIEAWKQQGLPVVAAPGAPGISVMRQVQLIIGAGVLVGSGLAWLDHPAFIALPALIGAGVTIAGATGSCALAGVVSRLPWNAPGAGPGSCATGACR